MNSIFVECDPSARIGAVTAGPLFRMRMCQHEEGEIRVALYIL
jgi:hypothetical protein